ncbi:MAG: tetratricopeptide repeat protein [Planctomycetaceae bacterium]|nr:tetratricopeptide repeat protein [Planctomycetaceae bacterium]
MPLKTRTNQPRRRPWRCSVLIVLLQLLLPTGVFALDLDETANLLVCGQYDECLEACQAAIDGNAYGEGWRLLKADVELLTGRYADARKTLETAIETYTWSVKLRVRLRDAYRFTGDADRVEQLDAEIARLVEASPWRFTDAESLVLLGWLALDLGADAKDVQESFFQRARRNNPVNRLPRLALGRLALDKRDFPLAADVFKEAVESFKDDPEMLFGLAEALGASDPEQAEELLKQVADINPLHVPLLLKQTDQLIESEAYDDAETQLAQVLAINEKHPEALAYWAVIAHLRNDPEMERELREEALSTWSTNPQVDHVIGRELSQKYRFEEGAAHQRQALEFDSDCQLARKQLASDLLRLGREEEGWQLVEAAHQSDQYDVPLYNLMTLREELAQFTTLERDGFLVRMEPIEAAAYGEPLLNLLVEAREQLTRKYRVELKQPVLVEIFPKQTDFAVRTFGIPGVAGYLGVCFGNVITATSPASQETTPANWESVLWHEFTHVITLNLTHNRMPRWVSEGISVYEERQRGESWGERMTPAYRQMILGGELTPVGELSGAFLKPKSAAHIQFAYYESSLVIEYLIDQYGFDALHAILLDLAAGVTINDALERHTAALPELESGFSRYATQLAKDFGSNVDWKHPVLDGGSGSPEERLKAFLKEQPNNYAALKLYAELLTRLERTADVEPVLRRLVQLHPTAGGRDAPVWQLAELFRKSGRMDEERSILESLVRTDDAAPWAYLRLAELESQRKNWEPVWVNALRLRAVDPLTPHSHRYLAEAAEHLGRPDDALIALTSLLAISPEDPAGIHFRMARILHAQGDRPQARRHVLMALEEAPRYRAAQQLLLEVVEAPTGPAGNGF